MKTQITSNIFWKLYKEQKQNFQHDKSEGHAPDEHMRHACILGLTSLDAAIYTYWASSVIPDWAEFISLVNVSLDNPSIFDKILSKTHPNLKKAQLVATLRFIHNTGDEQRFTPNFLDFAVYLLTTRSENVWVYPLSEQLIKLHKLRNAAFHTGRNWDIESAKECLQLIESASSSLINLGKNFADVFSEDARVVNVVSLKNAA